MTSKPWLSSSAIARAAAALCLACSAMAPVAAAPFTFSWTGDKSLDPTLTFSSDQTASLTGTLDIGVGAGLAFTGADITALALTLETAFGSFSLTKDHLVAVIGTVSADGLSATLQEFYIRDAAQQASFGCASTNADCANSPNGHMFYSAGSEEGFFQYTSDEAARNALRITAEGTGQVPLPGTLPLALLALGAAGWVSRTRSARPGR